MIDNPYGSANSSRKTRNAPSSCLLPGSVAGCKDRQARWLATLYLLFRLSVCLAEGIDHATRATCEALTVRHKQQGRQWTHSCAEAADLPVLVLGTQDLVQRGLGLAIGLVERMPALQLAQCFHDCLVAVIPGHAQPSFAWLCPSQPLTPAWDECLITPRA